MFLSIIIPMYNVEKYIQKCLESVLFQEGVEIGKDYEVIIINDGSTDNSFNIATKLTENIMGVNLLSQKNQGLSISRNIGRTLAKGEYIWFIDSDDWIEPFSVSTIINKLIISPVDVLKLRAYRYISDNNIIERHPLYKEDKVVSGRIEALTTLSNSPAQFNICRRNFLMENNLSFMPNVYHEDNEFIPRMYWFAKTVSFINTPLYFHRRNLNSITSTPNPKRAFDLIKVCESLSTFCHLFVEGKDKTYSTALSKFISLSINTALDIISSQPAAIQYEFNINLRTHKTIFVHLNKSKTPKYVIEALLFGFSNNYSGIYRSLNKFNVFCSNLFCAKK